MEKNEPEPYRLESPDHWTTYDCIATAAADLRFLLFEMRGGDHQERMLQVLGPSNYKAAQEYLACIDINLKKMGAIGLAWTAMSACENQLAHDVRSALEEGDVNTAWNLVEAATKG